MDAERHLTQYAQGYSEAMIESVLPNVFLQEVRRQIQKCQDAVDVVYRDVTESTLVVKVVVEIVHDGTKRNEG